MKKRRLLLSVLLTSMLLTSCASFNGATPAYRNGDLYYTTVEYPNLFRDVNAETMSSLIESKTDYIVLFSQKGCSSCEEFDPVIKGYINNTKQVVYKYDISSADFVSEFLPKYYESFFPEKKIITPSLFIGNSEGKVEQLSNNMFKTTLMLTNMMKEHLYETEVYNFSRLNAFKRFMQETSEFSMFTYDSRSESAVKAYNNYIYQNIVKSNKKSAILDIKFFSETDLVGLKELLNTDSFESLLAYKIKDQVIEPGLIVESNYSID